MLVSSITRRMPDTKRQGLTAEAIADLAKQDAEAFIQKECVGPLAKEAKHEVPYTVVSSEYQLIHICLDFLILSV